MAIEQMNEWEINKTSRSNRVAMICHFGEAIIISFAYIEEILKGARTVPYVAAVILLCAIPVIAEYIFYKKDKATPAIKHIVAIGYAIMYTFVMLTTNNELTFVYVIPMIIAISVFSDAAYSLKIDVGAILVNVMQIVIFYNRGIYTLENNTAQVEIQILVMILVGAYSVYTAKALEKNNDEEKQRLAQSQAYTENMLADVLSVSGQMTVNIEDIDSKIAELKESLDATSEAMAEVNSGSVDTADAVQKQLEQTENIQRRVQAVADGAKNIMDSMKNSKNAIDTGNSNIEKMVQQVRNSVESGSTVNNELGSLDEYMKQMNSIIDIINGITSQTSLLALNASIEAARAGEAGKGFAVVASEISQMANQTKEATVKITDLIDNVSQAIERVIDVSQHMIETIKNQDEITSYTAESFKSIDENAVNAYINSEKLTEAVEQLDVANTQIVDSISTISAISEEVAAHANDTTEASVRNNDIVHNVSDISVKLKVLAEQLSKE